MSSTAAVSEAVASVGDPRRDGSDRVDAAGFAALYVEHRDALHRYCVAKAKDRDRAEDLVQQVFAKAYANRRTYDPSRPFWPWLVTIAARECIDLRRRQGYATSRLPELARSTWREPRDDTWAAVAGAFEERRLAAQIDALPARQRLALQLAALEGWRYADIAEHFGCSVEAVKVLVVRARNRLRATGKGAYGWVAAGLRPLSARLRRAAGRVEAILSPLCTRPPVAFGSAAGQQAAFAALAVVGGLIGAGVPSVTEPPASPVPTASAPLSPATVSDHGAPTTVPSGRSRASSGAALGAADRAVNQQVDRLLPVDAAETTPQSIHATGFATSPNYDRDHTVVVAGTPQLARSGRLYTPLLLTRDGGATWTAAPATGLGPVNRLFFAPSYPDDPRIFGATATGLQVSHDGGHSFETLAVLPGATDAAAVEGPNGNVAVFVSTGTALWLHRDGTGLAEPVDLGVSLAGHRAGTVATMRSEDGDPVLLLDTRLWNPASGDPGHHISRCRLATVLVDGTPPRLSCATVRLPFMANDMFPLRAPEGIRPAVVYGVSKQEPLASNDGGRTWHPILPSEGRHATTFVNDMAVLPSSNGMSVVAAGLRTGFDADGRFEVRPHVARSADGGRTWAASSVSLPNFAWGVQRVTVTPTGRLFIAAVAERGIACSEDGGRTFAPTCPTPDRRS